MNNQFQNIVDQVVNEYSQHTRILQHYAYKIAVLKDAYQKVNYFKNYELMVKITNKINQYEQELKQYIKNFEEMHTNYPALYGYMELGTFKMLLSTKTIRIEVLKDGKLKFNYN